MSSTFFRNQHPAEYLSSRQSSEFNANTSPSSYLDAYSPFGADSESTNQSPATSNYSPSFGTTTEITPDGLQFGTFEDWMQWECPSDNTVSQTEGYFKIEPLSPVMNNLKFIPTVETQNDFKDSAIFGSISDDSLFPSSEEDNIGLYSTPLSWSKPALGRLILSPEEEAKLRRIAMPESVFSSSPEPEPERKKRKSIMDDDDEQEEGGSMKRTKNDNARARPMKKTAHNMIEKRYRTNLNDKIAALRDAVPSLRTMSRENAACKDEHGLTPAHKLNKATVLSKATEYIGQLEKRDKYLTKENAKLKSRIEAFEMLVMARQENGQFLGGDMARMI